MLVFKVFSAVLSIGDYYEVSLVELLDFYDGLLLCFCDISTSQINKILANKV